jgi:hypothetical protein
MKAEAAREIVAQALKQPGSPCVTSSFQSEDMVVVHLLLAANPGIPVLFLETGYHFPETLAYRDQMASAWNLNLVNLAARQSVPEQEAQFGILNQTDPDQCCKLRKVEPLFAGLADYQVWFTGLRREQSPTRAISSRRSPLSWRVAKSSHGSARSTIGPGAMSGSTCRSMGYRSCRFTRWATPALAASLAPGCRSTPTIPARGAGKAKASWSAASTSKRSDAWKSRWAS